MNEHDALIERLCNQAQPVKRLAAPWARATGWMLVALPCGFLAAHLMPLAHPDWLKPGAVWAAFLAALWILASLCLAALAITTALALGVPGRRIKGWRWLAACAVAWSVIGLLGVTASADPVGHFGDGRYCYSFMLLAGVPMAVVMVGALRRTRSLHPIRSLSLAGCGVAAMAQALLGFCHPVAGELVDLMMHLAAAITLVAVTALAGWRWVRI